ncbi:MAG: ATP-binding cassette domain-containing protein [Ottowia sp.]
MILADVEFTMPAQGVTALMGPSGSGKSTLLRTLAGLNTPNPRFRRWGSVRHVGAEAPRLIQQHARMLHSRTIDALLDVVRPTLHLGVGELRAWCIQQLREFELPELEKALEQPIHTLPIAQQRAVAILREAWAKPALLMVDEPTAELPAYDAYVLIQLLRQVSKQSAVLMATHHQRHAQALAGHMLLLAGGRILEARPMEAFLNAPLTAAGHQFVRTGSCAVASPNAKPEELADDVEPPPPLPAAALAAIAEFVSAEESSRPLPAEPEPEPAPSPDADAATPQAPVAPSLPSSAEPANPPPLRRAPSHAVLLDWNPLAPSPDAIPASRGPTGFSWLVPGRLGGTPWPGVVQSMETDLQALRRCGVTMLITLTEQDLPQEPLRQHGLSNLHLPIYDREPPTVAQTQMLLARMSVLLRKGEVLAVHCLAGLGRTGTILAAWLVREGLTAEEALRRVRSIQAQYVQSEAQEALLHDYEASLLQKLG